MKNILVTGGAGFIGSAFVRHMVATYPHYNIICFDKLTYAGNLDNLLPVSDETNYRFERGDIADRGRVKRVLSGYEIDTIVNFAAESHVDRSILDPDAFIHTDVVGAYILLDEGRFHGIDDSVTSPPMRYTVISRVAIPLKTTDSCLTVPTRPAKPAAS